MVRRLLRCCLNVAAGAALLLALGAAAVWARSLWTSDWVRCTYWDTTPTGPRYTTVHLHAHGQVIGVFWGQHQFQPDGSSAVYRRTCQSPGVHWYTGAPQAAIAWQARGPDGECWGFHRGPRTFTFPAWAGVLLPGFPAVLGLTLGGVGRRRRRIAAGLCVRCGYDLRASHDRCPECGAPIGYRNAAPRAGAIPPID